MMNNSKKNKNKNKEMKQILSILLIFFCISSNIKAQKATNETYSFSMQQCVDFAAKNQVDIVNSKYDEVIAKAKINEILGSGLPQVNGSVSLDDFLQIPTQLIPGEFFGGKPGTFIPIKFGTQYNTCLLYTSDAADDLLCVDLGGRRI